MYSLEKLAKYRFDNDNINSIIDTFNRNSKQQNSSIRMFINTKTIDILEHELEQNNDNVPRETGENNNV